MKRLIISLPDDLYSQLETEAKEKGISMAEQTRRALYEYLNAPATPNSPLDSYIEGIAGKTARNGGKIAGHGGSRPHAGRKSK